MSFLSGLGKVKLDGQKGLTKDKPILAIEAPNVVYIPLVLGAATAFDVHVQAGDHVSVGTKLATRKDMYVPIYSPVSGTIKGVEKRMHVSGRPQNHIAIENDHQNDSVKVLDIENADALTKEEIVNAMKELGLIGLGGAGFPTFMKYGKTDNIHTIIINAVECEPYLTSDHVVMMREPQALIDGTLFMMRAAECQKAVIAIKENKPELIEVVKNEAAKHQGVEVVAVPDQYPMGWERTLVNYITKKDYERLPGEVGVIVNNATTAIALSNGIRKGEGIYKRVVTVSGNGVKEPQNVEVTVGTPFNYVVGKMGGYADAPEGHVIAGGPMMGKSVMNDLVVITENTNGMTVLIKEDIETLPCLKCGACTMACPAYLQPVKIIQAEKRADVETLEKLDVVRCVECGVCTYVCPSKIEVTDFAMKAKRRVNLANMKKNATAKKN